MEGTFMANKCVKKIFFDRATPRAHEPVLHIANFFEKNKITF